MARVWSSKVLWLFLWAIFLVHLFFFFSFYIIFQLFSRSTRFQRPVWFPASFCCCYFCADYLLHVWGSESVWQISIFQIQPFLTSSHLLRQRRKWEGLPCFKCFLPNPSRKVSFLNSKSCYDSKKMLILQTVSFPLKFIYTALLVWGYNYEWSKSVLKILN